MRDVLTGQIRIKLTNMIIYTGSEQTLLRIQPTINHQYAYLRNNVTTYIHILCLTIYAY